MPSPPVNEGDDRGLVADAVEAILGCAADVAVGDVGDGDGPGEQGFSAGEPQGEVRAVLLHLCEEVLPAMAFTREIALLHDAAKIGKAVFHGLDAAVAAGIEHQFGGAGELGGLREGEAKVHLECDPSLRVCRAREAAQVVLAGGEEDGCSFKGGAVIEALPATGCRPHG